MNVTEPQSDNQSRLLRAGKLGFKLLVVALVCWGIWHTVEKSRGKFAEQNFSISHLNPWWLAAAGGLYLIGSIPSWLFWHQAMRDMDQRPGLVASLRAFYIGHLGKYVPGKAMVVIMRAGMIGGERVNGAVAATCVFVETLTTMAVGATLAAVYLALAYRDQQTLLLGSVAMAVLAGVPTLPPVFRRIVPPLVARATKLLRLKHDSHTLQSAFHGLRFPLIVTGWVSLTGGWIVMGLSLWATLKSLPSAPSELDPLINVLPEMTACVALSVVAGFASMLPAGVGAREFVFITVITPHYGPVAGIVGAVLVRLVSLLAEVLVSAILYFVPVRKPK